MLNNIQLIMKKHHLYKNNISVILFSKGGNDMLNQSILVGRIVKEPEVRETENGTKVTNLTLAVQRSYKNVEGEYDTDFISCVLWKGIAETTAEYCKKGDLIGVRGRLQNRPLVDAEDTKLNSVEVVAERVTFLSSKKQD